MLVPSIFGSNLFDDFMDFSFPDIDKELYGKRAQKIMKTDVKELDDAYEVMVDLPGFNKEDIHLELNDGNLTISAVKSLDKENESKGNYIRRERVVGNMQRSFYVGEALTEEDIRAKYENGILTLIIPKKEARKAPEKKYITIE
ncbi:MAG TPA: Hsp20/alpha crystallin family protein [Candidatus Avilachnospira avicola]|nr:Hsp20/alpha crystallin family protein [Candidatus Avilachnospira avicola]